MVIYYLKSEIGQQLIIKGHSWIEGSYLLPRVFISVEISNYYLHYACIINRFLEITVGI